MDLNYSVNRFESSNIRLYYNANMLKIMEICDIAISACGSTLYELAACGVPTLGIVLADNQKGIANKMSQLHIMNNLGWIDNIQKDFFIKELISLGNDFATRKEMSRIARKIIDGNGAKRIAEGLTRE